ncbi:MAG: beta-ketoacyl synthase N-terminal-like domain-containing protein [Butyricicoccus sp.]
MERVVITGMGAITPVGNDVPSFWESLKTGKCIGPIWSLCIILGRWVQRSRLDRPSMEKRDALRRSNVRY